MDGEVDWGEGRIVWGIRGEKSMSPHPTLQPCLGEGSSSTPSGLKIKEKQLYHSWRA